MRRIQLIRSNLTIVVLLSLINTVRSQSTPIDTSFTVNFQPRRAASIHFDSWEEELDYAKQGAVKNILSRNNLKLLSYKKVEKNPENIITSEFNKESWAVIPLNNNSIGGNFFIDHMGKNELLINTYANKKKAILNDYIGDKLEVAELKWQYKKMKFKTLALVSTSLNTVVYDDILSNISYSSVIPASTVNSE